MKVTYDAEVDVLRIRLNDHAIEESDEDKPGVIIDYDADGNVVGYLAQLEGSTKETGALADKLFRRSE